MRIPRKLTVFVAAVLLIMLPILAACDDGDTEEPTATTTPTIEPTTEPTVEPTIEPTVEPTQTETPEPTPTAAPPEVGVGLQWVYNVTYGEQMETWTITVIGEETVDGIATYVTEASFSAPVERVAAAGTDNILKALKTWLSQTSLDMVRDQRDLSVMGGAIELVATTNCIYSSEDHGAPLAADKEWSYDQVVTLDPPLRPESTNEVSVKVTGMESVTVPAGTFNCYVVEYIRLGGVILQQWWSTDNAYIVPVKIVNTGPYIDPEVSELVSYSN